MNRLDCFRLHDKLQAKGKGSGRRFFFRMVLCVLSSTFWLTTVYASSGGGGGHEGPNWFGFAWRLLNFIILIGLLYWLLSKKIREFLAERREGIRAALAEAIAARETAEKKFRECEIKLDKAASEVEQISEMIRSQGFVEKERIIEDARKTAEKMREDTEARLEQEFKKASQQLRIEAVRLSTQMAEELLKKNITAKDHEAMVKDYIEKVVSNN